MTAPLPIHLYRAAQVRELDRRAIEDHGIEGYELMQRAAGAAFQQLRLRWPDARNVWMLCGAGNNGGDGLVMARLAREAGLQEQAILLTAPDALRGAAAQALADYEAAGGQPQPMTGATLQTMRAQAEVLVDALLGTGLSRPVTGDYLTVIQAITELQAQGTGVLALDIPSGLHADTGAVLGASVMADCTVSFIGMKLGLLTGQGPQYCGDLYFDDLDVPDQVYAGLDSAARRMDDALLNLPRRSRTAHKGQHGRLLCIGGDVGTPGAIRIAAEAALRSGAGLVSVATRGDHAAAMVQARPELMARGVADRDELNPLLEVADLVVLGPGLGQGDWGLAMWEAALAFDKPMVLDADGLNLLARQPQQRDNWVLTPHPGEAARLLACSTAEVQADRPAAVQALQKQYGGVVLLKGAGSLVQADHLYLCAAGNPGMATGGMGDLLSGVIAGLMAQGLDLQAATLTGVYMHARAADVAAAELGERGLLPTDLWPWLRQLLNTL